jgi:hypothetical protein
MTCIQTEEDIGRKRMVSYLLSLKPFFNLMSLLLFIKLRNSTNFGNIGISLTRKVNFLRATTAKLWLKIT